MMIDKEPETVFVESRRLRWTFLGTIVAAVLFCYLPAVNAPLTFDSTQITHDGMYQVPRPIWEAVTHDSRSLVSWTFALNYRWGYPSTIGYGVVNIAIHLVSSLTLFALVRGTLKLPTIPLLFRQRATALAFAVALLWAIHPLQTMAVTYVVQRFESMMAMMFLLTMYFVFRGSVSNKAYPWYAAAIFTSFLGMACKPVMVMAAPVILFYDYSCLAGGWRELLRRRWWVYVGLFATSAWGLYLVRGGFGSNIESSTAGFGLKYLTPWEYLRTQPQILLHYLRLAIWPDALCIDYAWPVETSSLEIYLPGTVILLLLGLSLFAIYRWPKIGFLGLSFFLILAPTSSILPIADLAFEHRMYLPLAPLVVLFVVGVYTCLNYLAARLGLRPMLVGGVALGTVAVLLAGRTLVRNGDYRDPMRMWIKTTQAAPWNGRAFNHVGMYYQQRGDLVAATKNFDRALELAPNNEIILQGYGVLLTEKGEYAEAEKYFQRAQEIAPAYALNYAGWGLLYAKQGRHVEAVEKFARAIEANPRLALAQFHLARSQMELGEFAAAKSALEAAIEISPTAVGPRLSLAWLLATAPSTTLRDGKRSLTLIKPIAEGTGKRSPAVLDILAAAYAENGDYRQALQVARQARHLAQAVRQAKLVGELDERIASYSRNQPYRLPVPLR